MITNNIEQQIIEILDNYLEQHKLRKTSERYEILKAIYSIEGHFQMETLQKILLERMKFHVSRTTLYSTVDHLIMAHLLVRHQFPHISEFEKTIGVDKHHHLICTNCNEVVEFKDASLETALDNLKVNHFTMNYRMVYVYGLCPKCKQLLMHKK